MLHLPALVITKQIEKVFGSLQKISLAVRGLYGEGSQAMGDFYQISNQITLGRTESELVQQVGDVVPVLIDYERRGSRFPGPRKSRDIARPGQPSLWHPFARRRRSAPKRRGIYCLVSGWGVNLGLISDLGIPDLNELFIRTQPAHLAKTVGRRRARYWPTEISSESRYLRAHLNKEDGRGAEKELSATRNDANLNPRGPRCDLKPEGRIPWDRTSKSPEGISRPKASDHSRRHEARQFLSSLAERA